MLITINFNLPSPKLRDAMPRVVILALGKNGNLIKKLWGYQFRFDGFPSTDDDGVFVELHYRDNGCHAAQVPQLGSLEIFVEDSHAE